MPLESQEGRRWPAPLADRVSDGADAEQVADAIVAIWLEIDQALHLIIDHRGMVALYSRSLHLTAVAYPLLANDQPTVPAAVDPPRLRTAPHPNRARNPVPIVLIARGQAGLIDSRKPVLSIDEITLLILSEVRRLKASRVVLHSLSGFELALAPTFRTDFRESLLGLGTALARASV